jgi:hypothetical protein
MRSFDAILPAAILLVGMGLIYKANPTGAQQTPSQVPTTRPPVLPGTSRSGADDEENNNPMARQMAEQQAKRRNNQRQKQIVDDTTKLVKLAEQLKDEANRGKTGSDAAFTKKAEEIERLAKSVKDRMREGQ